MKRRVLVREMGLKNNRKSMTDILDGETNHFKQFEKVMKYEKERLEIWELAKKEYPIKCFFFWLESKYRFKK